MLKARVLWHDVQSMIAACEETTDESVFRTHWFCSVVMLRAVGHVLKKYDATKIEGLDDYLAELWEEWKTDTESRRIFFEFLDSERNQAAKEYEFSYYSRSATIPLVVEAADDADAYSLEVSLYRPFEDGRLGGADVRDLLIDTRDWWDKQLRRVEAFTQKNPVPV